MDVAAPAAQVDLVDVRDPVEPVDPVGQVRMRDLVLASVEMNADWRDSVSRLLLMGVLAAVGVGLIALDHLGTIVLGIAVLGIVSAAAISVIHETAHHAVFRHVWVNQVLGLGAGVMTFVPYAGYRVFHLRHHARAHEETDPEPNAIARSVWEWAAFMIASMFVLRGLSLKHLWIGLRGHNRRTRRLALLSLALGVVATAVVVLALLAAPRAFGLYFALPTALGGVIGAFFAIPEHYGCDYGPDEAVRTTRTTTSNALGRFIMWNGNYHAEHHLAPTVPTAHLPAAHRLVEPHLKHSERSYVRFHLNVLAGIRRGELPAPPPWTTPTP